MDYAMPRADDLPGFTLSTNVTLCTHNPLGVKGCGEAGAIGAPAAITNALVDALRPLGVHHLDMPATPEKLWRLIQEHRTPLAAE
jgi:carbon-monoxide dehydrogenase large subunit